MTMPEVFFAWTAPGSNYPEYVNIQSDGTTVFVNVRGAPDVRNQRAGYTVQVKVPVEAWQVSPTPAARDVLAERSRQVAAEGWTVAHDDEHDCGQIPMAAACYAAGQILFKSFTHHNGAPDYRSVWPWDRPWWKPKDARRNLVRAGALILAEIERLDRLSATSPASPTEARRRQDRRVHSDPLKNELRRSGHERRKIVKDDRLRDVDVPTTERGDGPGNSDGERSN